MFGKNVAISTPTSRRKPLMAFWPLRALLAGLLLVRSAVAEEAAPAAGHSSPNAASVDALVFDIVRIVDAEEGGGWLLDETAQRNIEATVMQSVCRAAPEVRAGAFERLERQSRELGDARSAFERDHGELTSRVEAALSAERRAAAARHAGELAPRCPFWVHADADFKGLQSTRDRLVTNFDTGGIVQLRRTQGEWALGAGGFGRALVGYSFTHVSVLSGIEFGGGALLQPKTNPTQFIINYLPAVPVIVRLHYQAWNIDLEGASTGLFQAGDTRLSYGVRSGITVGVSSLRLRGILPWVGIGVASEYYFANSARPGAFFLRGGLRVGGVWAP
jgi:hypothetical protein